MRLVSPKNCVRPSGDAKRSTGQASSSQTAPSEVDDSFAPIFAEDNKEVVLEYPRMCHYDQAMAPIGLPLALTTQMFEKKIK